MKKKLYIVDTICTFRHRYVVEAKSLEHAYDEVTMKESGAEEDYFSEFSQKYLGETIIDGRQIDQKEFDNMISYFHNNNTPEEMSSYWLGDGLIRKIDYKEK